MRTLLVLCMALAIFASPVEAASKYYQLYDSGRDYSVVVQGYHGPRADAKVVVKIKSKDEGYWFSAEIETMGKCEYGSPNCHDRQGQVDLGAVGYDDGQKSFTVYGDELFDMSISPKEQPWGELIVEAGEYIYLMGWKMSKSGYVKFVPINQTRSKFSWKIKEYYH